MSWRPAGVDASQILTLGEVRQVVAETRRRLAIDPRYFRLRLRDLIVFRLATCCGLRALEITELDRSEVHAAIQRPYLIVSRGAKRGKVRRVPLWLDDETRDDLLQWLDYRAALDRGGIAHDRVVVRVVGPRIGEPVTRFMVRDAYRRACGLALGADRVATITTHTGRHTFASHAVHRYPIQNVRDWLGHESIAMTSRYLHALDLAERHTGDLFASPESEQPEAPEAPRAVLSSDQGGQPNAIQCATGGLSDERHG